MQLKFTLNKLVIALVVTFGAITGVDAQCINSTAWGSGTAPTGGASVTLTTCLYAGEYSTLNAAVAGENYQSTTDLVGGFLTITQGSPTGPVVASGNSPLSWTATVSGTYYIHLNTSAACGTDASCHNNVVAHVPGGGGGGGCSDCNNATAIPSLPFNTSATTCGACDNFSSLDACGSSYMNGEDYVFTYTPSSNEVIDITLSGTLTWTGVFVTDACPSSGATCIGSQTSSAGNPVLTGVNVNAGQTYYITVSTWPSPDCTPFTIDVVSTPVVGGCSDCLNPTVIPSLPFNTSTTTCGACDNFSSLDVCASSYMNGEDYVFAYTPAINEVVDISLTGTLTWTGLFVTDACPSSILANCVGISTASAGNPFLNGVTLNAGQTYYIVVSTWPSPDCTPFTIDISTGAPSCSDGIQNQGETGVDCGGPCPACWSGPCSNCTNAESISGLPYNMSATTCGACNDYSSLNACTSTYMNGEDFVFEYTPTTPQNIDINLSGTNSNTGLFITAGCPDVGVCIGSSTSAAGNPSLSGIQLLIGQTYYIIVSTEPTPTCTPFTISISEVVATCSDGIQNQGETGVDCGGPCTPCTGPVSAGDCNVAVNICTNSSFQVDPSGYGTVDELLGNGVSNPSSNPNTTPGNSGCLLSGELNSTWMIINIASSGTLEFSLGAYDPIASNCYDWIMWDYDANTCADIMNNTKSPISCNWNGDCSSFTGMANTLPPDGNSLNFETALNVNCGEQYLICFSNYSSALTAVPFNFFGSAAISCTFFNPVAVNNETICEGQCASLNATGANSYSWVSSPDLTSTVGASVDACPAGVGTFNYGVTGVGSCGTGSASAAVTVLSSTDPVCSILLSTEIVNFQGKRNSQGAVNLSWQTLSEENNDYFVVQKSRDGIHFVDLEEVDGAGHSATLLSYFSKDVQPFESTTYYRIKQVGLDGQAQFTAVIAVGTSLQVGDFVIQPNPAYRSFAVRGAGIGDAELLLVNSLGKQVNIQPSQTMDQVVFDTSTVPAGLYLLIIKQGTIVNTRKIVIKK